MTTYEGRLLSVAEMLDASNDAPAYVPTFNPGVLHDAALNARDCVALLRDGEDLDECWRFGILQTLDDYRATLSRGGPQLAAGVFEVEPPRTGSVEVDAAFAALADHLAQRDGWAAPSWVYDPSRVAQQWFPAVPSIFRAEAERDSPPAFRRRGIFITDRSLARA